jgi:hypothetical protein
MKQNFFTAALAVAALESGDSPVGVSAVFTEQQDLQPKPGVGEIKAGEASLDDVKADKAYGDDAEIADADDIDTVAESQEHTLALEHLQAATMRFCRMGAALEEIAETAQGNLDAGQPMTPTMVSMVTAAVDASGIGEPMADAVATESFEFSASVATEGFIDAVKERAEQVWIAVGKFFKKTIDLAVEKLKRFADYWRNLINIYTKLEKDGELLASNAGKPFQSAKYEKNLHDRIWAPPSTKTVIAAVDNAQAEFAQVMNLADVKLVADIRALNNAWSTDKPETVVAAMNKVLATAKQLADMGRTKFMHSSAAIEVNLPDRITLDGTGGLEGTSVVFDNGTNGFSAGIKTATLAELKHLKASAVQAERAVSSMLGDLFAGDLFAMKWKTRSSFDAKEDDKVQARKLLNKYSNLLRVTSELMGGCVFGASAGYYQNHFSASKWVRFSIAEAKAANRGAK